MKKSIWLSLSYLLVLVVGIIAGTYLFHAEQLQQDTWTCPMHPEIKQPEPGTCPLCGMDLVLKTASNHQHESAKSHEHQADTWTCSMHPQIRQPEPGTCPLCGMDLVLKTASNHQHESAKSHEHQADTWTCSMHPQIRQPEPGTCPLCGMDLIPAEDQTDEKMILKMTQAAVELANIQTVKVKFEKKPAKEIPIEGRLKVDETQITTLVSHIPGRIEQLFITYTGEKVEKDQKLAALYSPDWITAQKELIEAHKIVKTKPELLDAAKAKLKFWKIPPSTIESILKKNLIQEHVLIHADYSGLVHTKYVNVGDHLIPGQVLFKLQKLEHLWAIFDLYESDLNQIKLDDQITFSTPAYPNRTFKAKVIFIDPVVDSKTRTASIRTEVDNRHGQLKPGMFINGLIYKDLKGEYLSIPRSAVMWTGKRSVVYLKVRDKHLPSFEYREVVLGNLISQNYSVLNGLKLGDEIVTHGTFVIDAEAQLNNQNSMMNQKVNLKE